MRVLVTGSAGFMGSHLVDALIDQGHTVYGLDNLSGGYMDNVSEKAKKNFYKCDLRRKDVTTFVMRIARPQVVYHLAAWAHEGLSQFTPSLIIENNINASMNLLVATIKQKVKRFVFTSSMAVYGDQKVPFAETMNRKPADVYGVTKAGFETMLEVMAEVHGFEHVIIRPHNVYGPRQNLADPYRNVVAIFMNRLLKDKPYFIYGDGEQRRSFSYIGDVTKAILEAGFRDIDGEIINVGPLKDYSINDLSDILLEISGKDIKPAHVADRPAEVKHAYCTHDKAIKLLEYEDTTSFKKGLETMWEWAKTKGPQKPKYLPYLELTNENTPKTWTEKMI